ncbi:MAG: shikimate dehydrogenase [Alphaproteobacteria bacterium]|nr:shikimate dehydrogenase [Alphaproteobacteria bacterium]
MSEEQETRPDGHDVKARKPPADGIARACVMGWPVSHSLSPKLHGFWLEKYGIKGAYGTMAITADNLKNALNLIVDRGYAGCNLTAPLKEAALSLMNEHDESCLFSGAVNTVVILPDGRLKGFNSDGFGFVESLKMRQPKWSGERVVILGTGGASRGVIVSLRAAGAKHFTLVNRTAAKAEKIVKAFSLDGAADILPWEKRGDALEGATLVVNCSTLGMADNPALDIELDKLPPEATVCDIVYRPLVTNLLKRAKARGNPVVEGLGMLLHQGRLGFEHWYGRDPEVTAELYAYMGKLASGKSAS